MPNKEESQHLCMAEVFESWKKTKHKKNNKLGRNRTLKCPSVASRL